MRGRLITAGCLSLILASSAAAPAGDRVLLKTRFAKGQAHYVEAVGESSQNITGTMGKMGMTFKKRYGQTEKVESTSMEGVEISITLDRMSFHLESQLMGNLRYDSDLPSTEDAPQLRQLMEPMLGETLRLKIDRDNNVTEIAGLDELVDKVEKKNQGNMFAAGFRSSFNKELIGRQFRTLQIDILPNKEVAVGDTWSYAPEEDMAQIGVKFDCTCELTKIGKKGKTNVAFIEIKGKPTEFRQKMQTGIPADGLEIKKGGLKGTCLFNLDENRLLERTIEADCTLATVPPKPAEEGEGAAKTASVTIALTTKTNVQFRTPDDRAREKAENAKKAAELKAKEEKEAAEEEEGDEDSGESDE